MTFCALHRMPEDHACGFDYVRTGKELLRTQNPKVVGAKIVSV